ncbi:hypothetical protein BH10ACT8_BH10ACT8_11220 [soil metagenome]
MTGEFLAVEVTTHSGTAATYQVDPAEAVAHIATLKDLLGQPGGVIEVPATETVEPHSAADDAVITKSFLIPTAAVSLIRLDMRSRRPKRP